MFKDKLRQLRLDHDMSQEDLAQVLDVSRQSISKYENGTAEPSFTKLAQIVAYFDVSYDYLLSGIEAPFTGSVFEPVKDRSPVIYIPSKIEEQGDFYFTDVKVVEKYSHIDYKPDALLVGINRKKSIFKGAKVDIAWYRTVADAETEAQAIKEAIRRGDESYVIRGDVPVKKRGFFSVQLADFDERLLPENKTSKGKHRPAEISLKKRSTE